MQWQTMVFDDPKMAEELGCSVCGLKVGDDGREFFRPRVGDATEDDAAILRELAKRCQRDLTEVWICTDCRDAIEKATA